MSKKTNPETRMKLNNPWQRNLSSKATPIQNKRLELTKFKNKNLTKSHLVKKAEVETIFEEMCIKGWKLVHKGRSHGWIDLKFEKV